MKALQTTSIVGLIAFMGFYLAGGNRPVVTVPDAMPQAAATASIRFLSETERNCSRVADGMHTPSNIPVLAYTAFNDCSVIGRNTSICHSLISV